MQLQWSLTEQAQDVLNIRFQSFRKEDIHSKDKFVVREADFPTKIDACSVFTYTHRATVCVHVSSVKM